MIYHCFSLLLLSYLVWRRPVAGTLVGILEGMWLLWPLYGLPAFLSFDVHLALALTCLFAWRADDASHSLGLAMAGGLVFGVLPHAPVDVWGGPSAVLGGVLCGELIVGVWLTGRLIYQTHAGNEYNRLVFSIRRAVGALASLNAPLGRDGEPRISAFKASHVDPIPERS